MTQSCIGVECEVTQSCIGVECEVTQSCVSVDSVRLSLIVRLSSIGYCMLSVAGSSKPSRCAFSQQHQKR